MASRLRQWHIKVIFFINNKMNFDVRVFYRLFLRQWTTGVTKIFLPVISWIRDARENDMPSVHSSQYNHLFHIIMSNRVDLLVPVGAKRKPALASMLTLSNLMLRGKD